MKSGLNKSYRHVFEKEHEDFEAFVGGADVP